MRKIVLICVFMGVLQAAGLASVTAYGQSLSVTAHPGGVFRTVELEISLDMTETFPRVYYLALAHGSPAPSVKTIDAYLSGRETAGLTDGTAVRGRWIASVPYEKKPFTLSGGENIDHLPDETGFIDGYRYDIYVVAVNPDGRYTGISAAYGVMAQAFAAVSADRLIYTVRTARQLQNIQRLADLYIETKGRHGSTDYLGYTYVLDADIHLPDSWTPIGNTDADARHVFRGSFDGNGHRITGLYMDKDSRDGHSYKAQGLFGKTENATLRNLTLENADLRVYGDFGREECAVGLLAGESSGGSIDHITVSHSSVTAHGPEAGSGDVGAVVGRAVDTQLYDITVSQVTVDGAGRGGHYAHTVGGLVGRYEATRANRVLKNIFVEGEVKAAKGGEVYAGGVAGRMEITTSEGKALYADNIASACAVEGGTQTGGLAGLLSADLQNATTDAATDAVTFDACRFTGRVAGYGNMGGLFGEARAKDQRSVLIKNAVSDGAVSGKGERAAGGLAGVLQNCTLEKSFSLGSAVTSHGIATGGFAGEVRDSYFYECFSRRDVSGRDASGGFVGIAVRSDFQSCGAENRRVSGRDEVGGFAGRIEESGKFYACYGAASVKGTAQAGGFVGSARGGALASNTGHAVAFSRCYATGGVNASGGQAGGFAGAIAYAAAGECRASGSVRANAPEAGGFCGRLSNMSRVVNGFATGDVVNTDRTTGGFVGLVTNASCVEFSCSAGDVTGYGETGGFAGAIAAYGAPNTLANSLSFAQRVNSPDENAHRFAGRTDHSGINDCYAYLGGVIVSQGWLSAVTPGAYGADGADFNASGLREVLVKLGWDENLWDYETEDGIPALKRVGGWFRRV